MDILTVKKLNNGVEMPVLGLGVFKAGRDTYDAVRWALEAGYRHIDTAKVYDNEEAVGKAVRDSGVPRGEIFITTKLWNDDMRAGKSREAFFTSLKKLDMDYVDLYLMHWPVKEVSIPAYKAMEDIYREGFTRAIGVSNFLCHHLEQLKAETEIVPAVDQIELHPYLVSENEIKYCDSHGIALESWSPLARGRIFLDKTIVAIAGKYGKTAAQVIIRWHLERGLIVIPKSVHKERIYENANVFDFSLTPEEVAAISALDRNFRTGSHPDSFKF